MRANAVSKENMDKYFSLFKEKLADSDLLDKHAHIYNMEKSGMPLDHKQPKQIAPQIAPKGMQRCMGFLSGNKSQITIIACGNAAGQVLPPMVIFSGEVAVVMPLVKCLHPW